MRAKHILLLTGLLLIITPAFSKEISLRDQLEDLNRYWKDQNTSEPFFDIKSPQLNDVQLIQAHLYLVEKRLRNANTSHLSSKQITNRLKCLDYLREYRIKGVFPKNLYHNTRTPYFIDDFGTACAVGQLIISTGYGNLAQTIRKEYNNGYIAELKIIYPEINAWAKEYGFTMAELAWIQPCYCTVGGPGTKSITCHGGHDGYFMPDFSNIQLQTPWSYDFYKKVNGSWMLLNLMCGPCNLPAGEYKMSAKDINNQVHDFYATLSEPAAADININITGDPADCKAKAVAAVSGGFPPYSYSWSGSTSTISTAVGLCNGTYYLSVNDSKNCYYHEAFTLANPTGIKELLNEEPQIISSTGMPLQLKLGRLYDYNATSVKVVDVAGRECIKTQATTETMTLNTEELNSGLYFITIVNGENVKTFKIYKQ